MKLLVIGATGGTGRLVLSEALRRGHSVSALVRAPEADLSGAHLVTGDVRDPEAVTAALAGVDAVVSCLGVRLGQDPGTVRSAGTAQLVNQMEKARVRRLVSVSTVGVGASIAAQSRPARMLWPRLVGRDRLKEAELAENAVRHSTLNWTVVRPPKLTDAAASGNVKIGPDLPTRLSSQLPRADLARVLVDLATDGRYPKTAVTVTAR